MAFAVEIGIAVQPHHTEYGGAALRSEPMAKRRSLKGSIGASAPITRWLGRSTIGPLD
jgi:hypothetical protein